MQDVADDDEIEPSAVARGEPAQICGHERHSGAIPAKDLPDLRLDVDSGDRRAWESAPELLGRLPVAAADFQDRACLRPGPHGPGERRYVEERRPVEPDRDRLQRAEEATDGLADRHQSTCQTDPRRHTAVRLAWGNAMAIKRLSSAAPRLIRIQRFPSKKGSFWTRSIV